MSRLEPSGPLFAAPIRPPPHAPPPPRPLPPWRICFSGFNLRLLDPCLLSRADGGHPSVRPEPPSSIIRWISIALSPMPGHGVHGTPLVPTYPNAPSTTTQEPTRDNDDPEHHPSFSQHHPTFEAPPGARFMRDKERSGFVLGAG